VIQENIGLYIENFSGTPYSDDENNILMRFGKVFQQTYTRFMDLKKAEEQAREAQIEASLERVRGRAMALQKSDELHEVIVVIHEELRKMGMDFYDCNIYILSKDEKEFTCWGSELGDVQLLTEIKLEINAHPVIGEIYTEFKKGNKYTSDNISGKKLKDLGNWLVSETDYKQAPEEYKKAMLEPDQIVFSRAFMNHGLLEAAGSKILPDDQAEILKRFANVIDLTYTRYDDLVQAEAQAREAQIEAGLERIRASTMAMHKSEQLSETAMVLFDQFYQLGQVPDRISIAVYNEKQKSFDFRVTDQSGLQLSESYGASIQEPTTVNKIYKAWKNKKKSTVIKLTGQKLKNWISFVKDNMKLYVDEKNIQGRRIHYAAFFSQGFLLYTSNTEMELDFINLLIRFAKVFDQTYTRFLDLKKAEIQAREAQIEASLERVRARAMAMQKSDELRDVVGLVSEELNISLENTICIIMNFDWKSKEIEWWSTGFNIDNLPESYKIPIRDTIKDHPLIRHYQEALRKGISYIVYKLEGEIKRSWDKYVFEQSELSKIPLETQNWMRSYEGVICNEAFMSHGVLEVDGPEQLSDENAEILQRFAKVVDLTYTRVEDLQQAEARAIEAVRQASLDRVRGVIASMRTKEDLNRITPLIWKELKALDVPFIRCGVFIMDVENEIIQSYLSTPDGKTLGVFNLPFTSELIGELMVDFWQKGKIYKEHWTAKRFVEFTQRLKESGQLKDSDSYQGAAAPPEKLDLHFIPFKQGMLYVGNTAPLTKDELELVKSLAEAFSIAYARYEDFRELELAKNQIESTLNELKSTQSQLIHAEKMASLGELTAGIAHEIQNPLNFVNNFSEVSVDLIEELKAERGKEDREREESLEVEILDDVIQNLEKINHHGQRASSIVKGMLEHSRTGSKDKQLTDINLLADEYLRLAYHGLRAKDKSFNADFKLEVDKKLPKIKVFPQDIGRVLLNLINNAFYAVAKKARSDSQNYKPSVLVYTGKIVDQIEIRVKDNGPGIPDEIKEKIFQPFFTTKPTGSGTGLGLSLSYDIVKVHGGELKVEKREGGGSEFIIQLPLS
jgi:signal transduction histidine kinase